MPTQQKREAYFARLQAKRDKELEKAENTSKIIFLFHSKKDNQQSEIAKELGLSISYVSDRLNEYFKSKYHK